MPFGKLTRTVKEARNTRLDRKFKGRQKIQAKTEPLHMTTWYF